MKGHVNGIGDIKQLNDYVDPLYLKKSKANKV